MKLTIKPLMPDGLPLDLDIDEAWLVAQMEATGKTAAQVIVDELDRGLEAGLRKAGEDMQRAINEMAARQKR